MQGKLKSQDLEDGHQKNRCKQSKIQLKLQLNKLDMDKDEEAQCERQPYPKWLYFTSVSKTSKKIKCHIECILSCLNMSRFHKSM